MSFKPSFDRGGMYIYPWYIADLTATKDVKQIIGANVKEAFIYIKNDFFSGFHDYESADMIGKAVLEKTIEDTKFLNKSLAEIYKHSDKLMDFCDKIQSSHVENFSNKELFNLYEEYILKLRKLRMWGWVPVFIDGMYKNYLSELIMEKFKNFLADKQLEHKLGEYYSVLSSSDRKSEVQTEELARINLIIKLKKSTKILQDIENNIPYNELFAKYPQLSNVFSKHLNDYGWLTYAYSGPTMTSDYLLGAIRDNLSKGDIEGQRKKIIKHYSSIKIEKKKITNKLSLTEELKKLFHISSEFMFIKDYRKGIYQKSYVVMDKVIIEMAKRIKLSPREIKYLAIDEIRAIFSGEKIEYYRQEAKKRTEECCYFVKNGKIKIYSGPICQKFFKKITKSSKAKKENKNIKELKGSIAYGGKVEGIVKIVLTEKDVAKVREGDILVSSATNPNLIVAMKKAAAFVTDTGGITSHAAIVSRELKKPCVVGTFNATHVLKDGDRVEVDADNGIVRIL